MGWADAPVEDAPAAPAWAAAPVDHPPPNMPAANKVFARTLGDAFSSFEGAKSALSQIGEGAGKTLTDVGQVYPAVEAGLNAATGLLFGFPASIGASLSGLYSKHVLGMDVDPKELADTMSRIATYQPVTERGQRLTGNLMLPLQKLAEGAQGAGEAVTGGLVKIGAPDSIAAGAGAVTDAAIQMLPFPLLGELHRKMGGQTIGSDDMQNVAKVVAGPDGTPASVKAAEASLRSVYDKTGIGPYTILEAAGKDPALKADLLDPNVDVPKAIEPFIPQEGSPEAVHPLDGVTVKQDANGSYFSTTTEGVGEQRTTVSGTGVYTQMRYESGNRGPQQVLNEEGDFVPATEINRNSAETDPARRAWNGDPATGNLVGKLRTLVSDMRTPDGAVGALSDLIRKIVTGEMSAAEAETAARKLVEKPAEPETGGEPDPNMPAANDPHIARLAPERQSAMHQMYADAAREKPAFDAGVAAIADEVGGSAMLVDLKRPEKAVGKVLSDYEGDPTKIKDLLRATVSTDSVQGAQQAVAAIFRDYDVLPTGQRNLFDDSIKPIDGYRDAKFNVNVNGHTAEIQVGIPEMLAAKKNGGHTLYDARQDLERATEGRQRTPAEQARIDDLNAQQRALYEPAWEAAKTRLNSASETGAPLRRTESAGNTRGSDLSQAVEEKGEPGTLPSETGMPSTSKSSTEAGNLAGKASETADSRFIGTSESIVRPRIEPGAIPAETIARHGLDDTPETRAQLASVAQAAGIDEAAVRAAAVLHADDEPAFHQAIQEIIDGEAARQAEQQGASDGGGGTGAGGQDPGAEPGATGDSGTQPTLGPGTLRTGIGPSDVVSAVRGIVKDAKDVTNGVIDSKAGQEVTGALFPMSKGGDIKAKAEAQRFANAMRLARFQWQRMADFIRDNFTADERRAMWDAADEENVLRTQGIDTTGKGLDRLTPKQRDAVEHLHELSQGLWKRAQDAGMVEGEGLPFWTPRMAVRIGEDGDFLRPGGEGQTATSKGEGGNVKTSTPNTKQRKYTLADETEAAMKARLGDNTELVRDIGTMPLAMARMAQAIAGRELVNQLKEYGLATGEPVISETGGPGFTTIDHPAFTTYRPDFITDADGKTVPRTDQNGDVVMTRNPMHISDEWAGPLKAVLSKTDGAIYRAYMLMKSKAMTAIMISPAAHNMVIWGRAMAYDPAAVGTLRAYFSGHALANDPGLMNQAISDGMVPMGANKSAMMDVTDVARGIGKEGGWGDPNESWINLAVQKAVNVFSEEAGTKVKAAMDAFGDFWHHTLLWKQVGALQTYIYNDYRNLLLEKGHPPEVAGPIAAHLANRYAGAVAAENSSEMLRKALNVMLFSRSFNVGNIGAVHDTAFGLPAGLRAKMMVDAGEGPAAAGIDAAKAKARKGIVADVGISMLLTAVTSAAVAKLLLNQTPQDIADGYTRRLAAMLGNIQDHPLNPTSYNPYRVLPTWDNEEGKQDRIDLGAQPGGRHEYLRLPTGKVVEDTVGWLLHAPDTFGKKLSPTVKAAWQSVTNDKGFGVPVEDPSGSTLKHIAQGMEHVIAAQVPMDQLKTLADVTEGHGTEIDKTKLAGAASGFTVSQGNPRGPEEAAFYAQQDRVKAEKAYAMEGVRDDIKKGDDAAAFERLRAIGIPPREIAMTINNIKNPRQGMSKQQTKRFVAEGNDADRASMENARRQTGPSIQTE